MMFRSISWIYIHEYDEEAMCRAKFSPATKKQWFGVRRNRPITRTNASKLEMHKNVIGPCYWLLQCYGKGRCKSELEPSWKTWKPHIYDLNTHMPGFHSLK